MRKIQLIFLLVFSAFLLTMCGEKETKVVSAAYDLDEIISSDTLRVATMYGPTSYFVFRDEIMGFDYEMIAAFAESLKVNLKLSIATNETEMLQWLQEGKVDVVAYNFVETKELKKLFYFIFPQPESYLVLVQHAGTKSISDLTELEGKSVYVKPNSIYQRRLMALNDELGGKVNIELAADSLSSEDLIEQVAQKKIEFTLAYHNTALLHKSHHKRLDVRMAVGFEQRNGWLIRTESEKLKSAIEKWESNDETFRLHQILFSKYWERSPYFASRQIKIPKGAISPYDHFFKKYAPEINWDWRLVAAVAFHESRFDSAQVSWAGASGLMQLMPRTARNFGLSNDNIFNPEKNIEAGVQYIKSLNLSFRKIEDKEERIKFILAAYNSGPAHIFDAMALAQKYGKNPHVWFNNVDTFLAKKSDPDFYNDPVVKFGRFGGKETLAFVPNILNTYEKYLNKK